MAMNPDGLRDVVPRIVEAATEANPELRDARVPAAGVMGRRRGPNSGRPRPDQLTPDVRRKIDLALRTAKAVRR